MTSEEWDRVFAVNAKGTFFTVQAALRRMLPRRQGRIVTIGSDSYKLGGGRVANIPYAATKGAVVTMTKGFARALVGTGVRINCVNPGPCDTPMHAPLTPEQRTMIAGRIPLGRFGLPEEIASAVLFLLSDAASFVYGESFNVDGGVLMEIARARCSRWACRRGDTDVRGARALLEGRRRARLRAHHLWRRPVATWTHDGWTMLGALAVAHAGARGSAPP